MNSLKILFAVALIALSCITYTHAIKCYTCDSKKSCKSAKKVECNYALANNTRMYLDFHHTGVNMNVTSPYLDCFREEIESYAGEFHYKGCTYSSIHGCSLPLRPMHTGGLKKRECNQCNNKDGCNPAGRADTNVFAVSALVIMGLIGRYVWA